MKDWPSQLTAKSACNRSVAPLDCRNPIPLLFCQVLTPHFCVQRRLFVSSRNGKSEMQRDASTPLPSSAIFGALYHVKNRPNVDIHPKASFSWLQSWLSPASSNFALEITTLEVMTMCRPRDIFDQHHTHFEALLDQGKSEIIACPCLCAPLTLVAWDSERSRVLAWEDE